MATTYFEIGGYVVESYVDGELPPVDPLRHMAVRHGVPGKVYDELPDLPRKISRAVGRTRRAQVAFKTALAMAAADGALPFGDVVAVIFLVGYGLYELKEGVAEFVE